MADTTDAPSQSSAQSSARSSGNVDAGKKRSTRRGLRRAGRAGLSVAVVLLVLGLIGGFGLLALTGKPIRLPVWAVAEVEARGNALLARDMPGAAIAVGGIEITIDSDWTPRLRLEDLRLLQGRGSTLLALPDLQLAFDASSALKEGKLRPRSLRLIGANVALRRQSDGRLDIQFGTSAEAPPIRGLADLLARLDKALATPLLARLALVEAEGTSLTLQDAMTGRVWTVGDGRMRLDIAETQLAAAVSLSLVGGGEAPAQAEVTLIRPRGEARLRMSAAVTQVAARDIAAQSPLLSWLGVLAAPISGRINTEISAAGVETLEAEMEVGRGALQPSPAARPIPFDRAAMRLSYNPLQGRITLTSLSVSSPSLRFSAKGHAYPLDGESQILTGALGGRLPETFLGQVQVSEVQVDPEGLFERPLVFTEGAMDARLSLDPFRLDIGQISLVEEKNRHLSLKGHAAVRPDGWTLALDLALDAIQHDRLLQLWPKTLVPKTRDWVGQNVATGLLTDVKAAVRIAPGTEPRVALGYEFDGAEVTFLRTLPPIRDGRGRSSLEGKTYMVVLEGGTVEAPLGGKINAAGSVFKVPDVSQKPARAEIRLKTDSTITAALSLLDLPPFGFMTKAGQPADLGEGRAIVDTRLSLPLQRRVQLQDVDYAVTGTLTEVVSEQLVKARRLTAERLSLQADPKGLTISGPGRIGKATFDVAFRQDFGPEAKGRARIEGDVALSPDALAEFDVALPKGMVRGSGKGRMILDLVKGKPGLLRLSTDLAGIGLAIPAVGWSMPANAKGALDMEIQLGQPPQVTSLDLKAPGLSAKGRMSLKAGGGLDEAAFTDVALDGWLKGAVTLKGRGSGRAPDVTVSGGEIDLRKFNAAKGAASGNGDSGSIRLALDRLIVSDGISLVGLQGEFGLRGGFNGAFRGSLNGAAPVSGKVIPSRHGSAVQVVSNDAGAALKAAGVFTTAKGGALEFRLFPQAQAGTYAARAEIRSVRVRKTSALAELLSAISVVGLLEQLDGTGILFNEADFDLILTPNAVEITNGSAVGASLGVSVAGLYGTKSKRLALQGVVSPIYLVNGIGAAVTRRGEGLFGFNYALSGTSDDPQVQVNPLSILTPGLFRELFRSPPPALTRRTE